MMMKKQQGKNGQSNNSPFSVPINTQLFGYYQWCEAQRRLNKSRRMRKSNKMTRICPAIEKKDVITSVVPMAITDIDAEYFTDLAGRPIKEKFSRHRYVEQIREVLRARLLIGYDRDDCLRIDQQFDEEKKRLAAIERQYCHYNSAFEEYLSNDHETSMKILNEAHQEIQKSNNLAVKRDELSNKFGRVRLEVYQWEEMWRIAKMCHEFFHKITCTLTQLNIHDSVPSKKVIQRGQRTSILGSLENLVEVFEKDISNDRLGNEEINLKDPQELSQIFVAIEQRNLDALIHLESLAGPIAEMSTSIVTAEELIGDEIRLIEESLEELKLLIKMREQRATKLKSYADYLLHEVFRELVCSDSVLHLRVFIEDTYESCVGPNDASLDGYSMMRVIEKTYESLNMTLDSLPRDIVRVCEKEGFAQEMRTMKEAEDAARKFDLMHRLLAALEKIMGVPNFDSKSKSKQKLLTRTSKEKLTSPSELIPVDRTKNYPKLYIPQKKFHLFIDENCQSIDSDIANELMLKAQNAVIDKIQTEDSLNDYEEDCRDKLSNIS